MNNDFKQIKNFPNYYINNKGLIISTQRKIKNTKNQEYILKEKILKPFLNKNGYWVITLRKDKKSYLKYVHILVAETFLNKLKYNYIVNHKNGNKLDNYVENLEWCSYSENNFHAYKTNLKPKGEKFYNSKLKEKDVLNIRKEYKNLNNYNILAKKYKVSRATIRDIILYKTWKNIN